MHIRRVEHTLSKNLDYSSPIASTQDPSGENGLLNFSIALGGIFLVTIITGIIAYLYRKKLNCRQKISSEGSKGSKESSGRISCIMDYYSNDYIINSNNDNRNRINNNNNGLDVKP